MPESIEGKIGTNEYVSSEEQSSVSCHSSHPLAFPMCYTAVERRAFARTV